MRAVIVTFLVVFVFACEKASPPSSVSPDAGVVTGAETVERPNTLAKPPSGGLPAELKPPR